MDNLEKIQKKKADIVKLKADIQKLEIEQALFDVKEPKYKLAEIIHDKMCRSNHTDGCGWDYESWETPSYSRIMYLEKAEHILSLVNYETAVLVIKNM